jgi:PAS domain S-box-containing protein
MISLLEDYICFLKCLSKIETIEYILFSDAANFPIEASSIELPKFFASWTVTSKLNDFILEPDCNAIKQFAREDNGVRVLSASSFVGLNIQVQNVTAFSLMKGYISLIFNLNKNNSIPTEDYAVLPSDYSKAVFFGFNLTKKRIDFISSTVEEMIGYTSEEIQNSSSNDLLKLFYPEDLLILQSKIESFMSGEMNKLNPITIEYRIRDNNEHYHHLQQKFVFQNLTDHSLFLLGIIWDITQKTDPLAALHFKDLQLTKINQKYDALKRTYDDLIDKTIEHNTILEDTYERMTTSEEIFRQLAENTNDILWLRNEKEILYINNQFERTWGRNKAEVIENPYILREWIHPDDRANFEPWVNLETLVRGLPYVEQYRIIKPDGEIRWLWSRIFSIFNKEGKPYRLVGIASDITEQKDFEDALRIAKEKAQESDMLKSTFLANISHEIRTPMNGIVGFAELLSREEIETETRKSYVSIMKKSSEQLVHIIDDIIDFAKIEANQIRIVQEKTDINRMLDQLCTIYKNLLNQKEIDSVTLIIEKAWNNSESIIISDEHRLNQILSYLIENAIKYTLKGFIKFGYQVQGERIEFYVIDSGIGIPKDKHELIFERFRQVDEGNTRKYGGTGLGLPIAKGLVNLLGGSISMESEPDKGSKFYFSIPLIQESQIETRSKQTKVETNLEFLKNKLILVAEDDELNYEYIKVIMEPTGAKLIRAKDGSQVIKICTNLHFDLILMDIRLPVMNGIQASRQLRDMGIKTPIIAQTAFAMDEDEKMCIDAGCNAYIAKPLNSSKLFKLINNYF